MNAEQEAREKARGLAMQGVSLLAKAINHLEDPASSYRYGRDEQGRFFDLAAQLVDLVERGQIEIDPVARARFDPDFQAFMRLVWSAKAD
jgi:hypothetical protein